MWTFDSGRQILDTLIRETGDGDRRRGLYLALAAVAYRLESNMDLLINLLA